MATFGSSFNESPENPQPEDWRKNPEKIREKWKENKDRIENQENPDNQPEKVDYIEIPDSVITSVSKLPNENLWIVDGMIQAIEGIPVSQKMVFEAKKTLLDSCESLVRFYNEENKRSYYIQECQEKFINLLGNELYYQKSKSSIQTNHFNNIIRMADGQQPIWEENKTDLRWKIGEPAYEILPVEGQLSVVDLEKIFEEGVGAKQFLDLFIHLRNNMIDLSKINGLREILSAIFILANSRGLLRGGYPDQSIPTLE